jgi:transcriptional regulator with XRE-family HTH domain
MSSHAWQQSPTQQVGEDGPVHVATVACRSTQKRRRLKQRKISMGKLSRMSDVSFTTIRRMCNDPSYSPTLNTLVSIAKALGVKVDDLYEDLPDDPT